MSTTTHNPVIANRAESMRKRYNALAGWLTKCDNYSRHNGPVPNVRSMPSKTQKGWMYDDAYHVANTLGHERATNLGDIHALLVSAKATGLLPAKALVRPVPECVSERVWA